MVRSSTNFVYTYWHLFALIGTLIAIRLVGFTRMNERGRALAEFGFAWAMALTYFLVRGVTLPDADAAFAHADQIVAIERQIGVFLETAIQGAVEPYPILMRFANFIYVWWHWPVIVPVLVWLYLKRPGDYPIYRNAFLISGAIGLVIFALYPVAPPRFLDSIDIQDTVSKRTIFSNILLPPSLTNVYAAMPSLHAGWNLLVGIALVRHATRWYVRLFGIVMPVLMFWSIVATGNHYIVDGMAGDLIAEFGLLLAILLAHRGLAYGELPAPVASSPRTSLPSGTAHSGMQPDPMSGLLSSQDRVRWRAPTHERQERDS